MEEGSAEPTPAMQDETSHAAVDDNSETAANISESLHLSGTRKWTLVCLLLAVTFLTRTERSLISTIYPTLAEEHSLTPDEIGLVFAAFDFSSLLSCLLWGKVLAGRWVTIKAVYMIALLGTTSSSAVFGVLYFIHNSRAFLAMSITVRILMGIFSGAIFVSEAELIIKILSPDRISQLLAWIEVADTWGFLAGPFVGAVLYQMTGAFYTPFVIMSLLILAVGLIICGFLPTTKSIAQTTEAVSGEAVGIWGLLRVPLFFACLMAMFFVFMIFAQGGTFNTLHLTTIYQLSPMQASGVYIGSDLSYTVFTMATGWVSGWQRGWEERLIVASYAALSALCTLLGPAPYYTLIPDPPPLWQFIVTYLAISGLAGIAISAAMTLGYHTIESLGVGGSSSMTVALIRSTGFLAFGIGSTLGGTVYARLGWAWMFTVMGYVTAANTVLFALLLYFDRRQRASMASQDQRTPLNILTQLISPENINKADEDGMTPLHRAVACELYWLVPTLLHGGADPNMVAGFCSEITLKSLCIIVIRSHMSVKTDIAFETLGLPKDLVPDMKMVDLVKEFVSWWEKEMAETPASHDIELEMNNPEVNDVQENYLSFYM